jgi:hypothetical protein
MTPAIQHLLARAMGISLDVLAGDVFKAAPSGEKKPARKPKK